MKAQITFEPTEDGQGHWIWHYGNLNLNGIDYPFTLLEMYDGSIDYSSFEVTWCEQTPENSFQLEKQIEAEFQLQTK